MCGIEDIHLLPTHPDFLDGLGFLLWAQQPFGILFAAAGSVIQASSRTGSFAWEILSDFKFSILGFFVMAVAAVMAPLLSFNLDSKRSESRLGEQPNSRV